MEPLTLGDIGHGLDAGLTNATIRRDDSIEDRLVSDPQRFTDWLSAQCYDAPCCPNLYPPSDEVELLRWMEAREIGELVNLQMSYRRDVCYLAGHELRERYVTAFTEFAPSQRVNVNLCGAWRRGEYIQAMPGRECCHQVQVNGGVYGVRMLEVTP